MSKIIFKYQNKYSIENSAVAELEKPQVNPRNLEIAQKLRNKIDKLNDPNSVDYLSVLNSSPNVKKELDEKKANRVAINYSFYIEQVKAQFEANLANIETKYPEIKRHGELTSQKTELAEKIKSIETTLSSTESAFNPDGSINATFIRQYRESKKTLESVNEPIQAGKRINLTSENTKALERLKVDLGNVESQLAEFEIVDQVNATQ
jgi:hypothetical protein